MTCLPCVQLFFFQLREEYGYEINPNDPQFAERIEEKEKEIAKAKKQDKKTKQLEQKEKYAAKLQAEKEEKLKKVQVIQLKCLYKHSLFVKLKINRDKSIQKEYSNIDSGILQSQMGYTSYFFPLSSTSYLPKYYIKYNIW